MLVECDRCGAPLDVTDGQRFVKCGYCRGTQATEQLRTTETNTPDGWKPPDVWHAPEHRRAEFPHPMRLANDARPMGRFGTVAVVLGVSVAIGAVVSGLVGKRRLPWSGVDANAPPWLGVIDIGPAFPVRFDRPGIVRGTTIDGSRIAASCRGHFGRAPHARLRLRQHSVVGVTTASNADLTMALRMPDGSFRCDDDHGEGMNPLIQGAFDPGDYGVWIGAFNADATTVFTLTVEVRATGVGALANGLAPDAPAQFGRVDLDTAHGGAFSHSGTAAGSVDAHTLTSTCRGYFAPAPSVTLDLHRPRYVAITTVGTADLTAMVRDPHGVTTCDDDSGYGSNPRLASMLAAGTYQVWIGTYSQSQSSPYTLTVASETATAEENVLAPGEPPTFGVVDLAGDAGEHTFRGLAIGRVDATNAPLEPPAGALLVDPACRGGFPAGPTVALRSSSRLRVSLGVRAQDAISVLVRPPDGRLMCLESRSRSVSHELDARPGETLLWIGTTERERNVAYVLAVGGSANK